MIKLIAQLLFFVSAFTTIFLGGSPMDRTAWYLLLFYFLGYLIYAIIGHTAKYFRRRRMQDALLEKAYSELKK